MEHYEEMIKTIIVDDHPLVIEGLKRILNSEDIKVSVEGEATDSRKLFNALETISPDIIILDIELPEKNGLDILKDLRKRYLQIPVLMLSMYPADRFAVRSFQAGASGYLTKKSIPEEIEKALKMIVYENKKYITAEVAEALAEQIDDHSGQILHKALSDREYQVMCLIAAGREISEIAKLLSLGVRTVHTYRARMMDKMNLKSNVDIAHYAISNHLINQP